MTQVLEIADLKSMLKEKFPSAHRSVSCMGAQEPSSDERQNPRIEFSSGTVSELVSTTKFSGVARILSQMLSDERDIPIALIDGRDSFDPESHGNEKCARLVWVRCRKTEEAIHCADLLSRDGNLPLVLLDLHLSAEREIRQIANAVWHRFKMQARESGTALVAITPRAAVPSPHRRLTLNGGFSLEHLYLKEAQPKFSEESPSLKFRDQN